VKTFIGQLSRAAEGSLAEGVIKDEMIKKFALKKRTSLLYPLKTSDNLLKPR